MNSMKSVGRIIIGLIAGILFLGISINALSSGENLNGIVVLLFAIGFLAIAIKEIIK